MRRASSKILTGCLIASCACWSVAASVHAAPAGQSTAASPAESQSTQTENYFDIHEYRVLGNTVLSNLDIETLLYPLLGDHKTLKDVEAARTALEKTYHDRGFGTVFVDIPEQDVSDKIVRLKVTEGRFHEVRIGGAHYFSERKILAAVTEAREGTVPNLPVLQSQISAVSVESADRAVVPILKAGPVPGTVDLDLKVDDHLPFHGSVETDNQNTPDTKPLRSTINLAYNNLFQDLDSLSAQYQLSPQDTGQVRVFAVNYAFGPLANGLRPSLYFINSDSNVPTVGTIGVIGKGQIYGGRLGFYLNDSPVVPRSITLGIDYKHFDQTINLASSAPDNTPITYTNLSLAYAGVWSSDRLTGSFASAANFGPRGVPNDQTEFANKRFAGQANYFYVKLDGSLVVHLPKGFQWILRADGQFAAEPLITNEDFTITGADGVRGYLEAEVLADKGIKGSTQFQTPVARVHSFAVGDFFVFYDVGRANAIDAEPNQPDSYKLSSYGAGIHLLPAYWLNGSLTWADPLRTGPDTRRGDSRILFVVRASF